MLDGHMLKFPRIGLALRQGVCIKRVLARR